MWTHLCGLEGLARSTAVPLKLFQAFLAICKVCLRRLMTRSVLSRSIPFSNTTQCVGKLAQVPAEWKPCVQGCRHAGSHRGYHTVICSPTRLSQSTCCSMFYLFRAGFVNQARVIHMSNGFIQVSWTWLVSRGLPRDVGILGPSADPSNKVAPRFPRALTVP